jgi:hypothetical protein
MPSKLLVIPAALAVAVIAVATGCSDDVETTTASTGTGSGTATGMGEIPPCPSSCSGAECVCEPCVGEGGAIRCVDQFCEYLPETMDCEPLA